MMEVGLDCWAARVDTEVQRFTPTRAIEVLGWGSGVRSRCCGWVVRDGAKGKLWSCRSGGGSGVSCLACSGRASQGRRLNVKRIADAMRGGVMKEECARRCCGLAD